MRYPTFNMDWSVQESSMGLERPANYRGRPGTRNITATANVHATKGFCAPSIAIVSAQICKQEETKKGKEILIIEELLVIRDHVPRITAGRIQDLSLPNSNLISVDARRLGLSILARSESVPVPVSVPVTFTCITRVPRLLNCVLRYILFARYALEGQRYARPRPSSPRTATVESLLNPSSGLRVGVSGWLRCARLRYETGTLSAASIDNV